MGPRQLLERRGGGAEAVLQLLALTSPNAAVVQEGAAPMRSREQLVPRRVVDHAVRELAAVLDSDRNAILRKAVDEIGGAVERIDDPPVFLLPRLNQPRLCGENAVVGIGFLHHLDDRRLGRAVDLGDEIVGALRLDLQAAAVERGAIDDRAGAARGAHGDVEHRVHGGGILDCGSMARIRIVLCRPSHPGNIGAAARAMKTMGLSDLRLVAPEHFPAKEADWMATNAGDVLANARVHPTLENAVEDCVAAYALSARPREWSPQLLAARAAAANALKTDGNIAFVFGNESAGLTNEEMFACQFLVHIPANPEFSSLNLAQAVQVVAYELFISSSSSFFQPKSEKLATVQDLEGMYAPLPQASLP